MNCPHCGYCSHCGRSNYYNYGYRPYWQAGMASGQMGQGLTNLGITDDCKHATNEVKP